MKIIDNHNKYLNKVRHTLITVITNYNYLPFDECKKINNIYELLMKLYKKYKKQQKIKKTIMLVFLSISYTENNIKTYKKDLNLLNDANELIINCLNKNKEYIIKLINKYINEIKQYLILLTDEISEISMLILKKLEDLTQKLELFMKSDYTKLYVMNIYELINLIPKIKKIKDNIIQINNEKKIKEVKLISLVGKKTPITTEPVLDDEADVVIDDDTDTEGKKMKEIEEMVKKMISEIEDGLLRHSGDE